MPWPLYCWGKNPQYPSNRMLGEARSQSGCIEEEKIVVPLPGPVFSLVAVLTELSCMYRVVLVVGLVGAGGYSCATQHACHQTHSPMPQDYFCY